MALLVVVGIIGVAVKGIFQIILPPKQLKVLGGLHLEAVIASKETRVLAVIFVAAPTTGGGVVGPEPLEVDLGVHYAPDLVFFGAYLRLEVVSEPPTGHLSPADVEVVKM